MKSTIYKAFEFLIVFLLIPISFVFNYVIWIKLGVGLLGFLYVVFVLLVVEKNKFKISQTINWSSFWRTTIIKFFVIALLTGLLVYFTNKSLLFYVVLNKPLLWFFILFIYSFLSVYPQELIYRTLYFQRYADLFKSKYLLIVTNALVFSLAHIFFRNYLVMLMTFIGGVLFAITYYRTQSTLLVSIEHAIYGCWLFTVGMGGMLGFPS